MSSHGAASPRSPPFHRPRHQISRSISELSSPIRLHRHEHPNQARRDRERDDRTPVPQSAVPLLQAMEPPLVSKSEGVTPNLSPNQSRRASILAASDSDVGLGAAVAANQAVARKMTREEQLRLEQQKADARTIGLKKSLADLNTFSTTATRRLDDSFYSALEKLGALQATIVALKELAKMCQDTNATFKKESDELAEEINFQLDTLRQFEEKESRVESLKGRIRSGREKITALSNRVDAVRGQVESWERADKEWQERTRRRLKVIWVVMSLAVFVLLLLIVSAQYTPADRDGVTAARFVNESLDYLQTPGQAGQAGQAKGPRKRSLASTSRARSQESASPTTPDDRLRIFDEL